MNEDTQALLSARWEEGGSLLDLYRDIRSAWCIEIGRAQTPLLRTLPLWLAQAVLMGAGFTLRRSFFCAS